MNAAAEPEASLQREWWLRALTIFQSPSIVFTALRDDSEEAADARQEPVLAIVLLAGFAGVLSTSLASRVLDNSDFGGSVFAVLSWAFLGGTVYGFLGYWVGGLVVYALTTGFGGSSSYRQARHIVAFAAAPLALSLLLVWPVRVAIYGGDLFRAGGSDTGVGDKIFEGLVIASFVWMIVLVVVGVRAVNAGSWPRRR